MKRRDFLRKAGVMVAAPVAGQLLAGEASFAPPLPLAPIRATGDRVIAVNVCSRPFRAQGPRIEAERIGRRTVVHNYGHGGAGWSLSWGSAARALELVQGTGEQSIAVIGCGAIGLTTAVTAQRAGMRVRIYARERPPEVSSSFATGVWTPDSRICSAAAATPDFERQWEAMARTSYRAYQGLLGLAGAPVEWHDGYALSDVPFGPGAGTKAAGEPEYPALESRLLGDLRPASRPLNAGEHPFPVAHVARYTMLGFNISALSRLLMDEFLVAGGELESRTFDDPREFAGLREKVLVNATGYGARQLLGDESIVPVRGQTTRLIPQPEVTYGLYHLQKNLFVVPRRDGIVVQSQEPGDFGNPDTRPDRAASSAAIHRLASLFPPAGGHRVSSPG
ncbi:MAG: FAD-dependent oxidoreductase [Gammaproteobacteria bacterium]